MCADITYKTYTLQVKTNHMKMSVRMKRKLGHLFCRLSIWCDKGK